MEWIDLKMMNILFDGFLFEEIFFVQIVWMRDKKECGK